MRRELRRFRGMARMLWLCNARSRMRGATGGKCN